MIQKGRLREHRRPTNEEQENKGYYITFIKERGTSAAYRIARLDRDRPDLALSIL